MINWWCHKGSWSFHVEECGCRCPFQKRVACCRVFHRHYFSYQPVSTSFSAIEKRSLLFYIFFMWTLNSVLFHHTMQNWTCQITSKNLPDMGGMLHQIKFDDCLSIWNPSSSSDRRRHIMLRRKKGVEVSTVTLVLDWFVSKKWKGRIASHSDKIQMSVIAIVKWHASASQFMTPSRTIAVGVCGSIDCIPQQRLVITRRHLYSMI